MERFKYDDSIYALATPPGTSAVAVVRCSGDRVHEKLMPILSRTGGAPLAMTSHQAQFGHVVDPATGQSVDEVIVLYMAKPRTFTREDVVEIQCHGSMTVVRRIFSLLDGLGLRVAEPGEFTRRAFMNGRIGLTEAEGINDLIHSLSDASARVALDQMHGSLRQQIGELRQTLIDMIALIEANIDFPEEDIDILDRPVLLRDLRHIEERIATLQRSYQRGRRIRDGVQTLITGRPNAGKSSLLNLVLKTERAIVSEIPGTTRDSIEESFAHRGVLFRLVDTAGLRASEDSLEVLGIQRARHLLDKADLILYVVDASQPTEEADRQNLETLPADRTLVVLSKGDLPRKLEAGFEASISPRDCRAVSSITGSGVDHLLEFMRDIALTRLLPASQDTVLTNERHLMALTAAHGSIVSFLKAFEDGIPLDVALIDLYETTRSLGLVIGEVVTEDILDRIFEKFCIGK